MSTHFVSCTPMLPSGDSFEEALRFYREDMGFRVTWQDGNMAGIERDGVSFNLVHNNDRQWAENSSFSIGVRGLDALYAQYRTIPAKVGALETKAWGRREFHVIVASGVCFQYYEAG